MLRTTNQDSTINQLQLISEKREDAIAAAKVNCQKLKNYMTYGIPSVIERMPNTSNSILKSSDSNNHHDIKCEVITAEQNDYDFIYRMRKLIYSLPDTYKNTFVSIFIDGKSIRSFHRNDIYTILKRGYLKLALLDATIDYSAEDEMKYQNYKLSHKTKKTKIVKKMKAKLFELRSLIISGAVRIEKDELSKYILINQSASIDQYNFYSQCMKLINELHLIKNSSLNAKEAIICYGITVKFIACLFPYRKVRMYFMFYIRIVVFKDFDCFSDKLTYLCISGKLKFCSIFCAVNIGKLVQRFIKHNSFPLNNV